MIEYLQIPIHEQIQYGMLQDTITKNWQIPDVQPLSSAHTQHPPIGASSSLEPPEQNDDVGKCEGKQIRKSGFHKPNFGHSFFLTATKF